MIEQILSGGQTGADQGGLDAALKAGIPHGGWCPASRRSEDGPIPSKYLLQETEEWAYPPRTRLNIMEAEGTIVFTVGEPTGGSKLTISIAEDLTKPCCHVDLAAADSFYSVNKIVDWVDSYRIRTVNVAGSRESSQPGIQSTVADIMLEVIKEIG